MSSCAEREFRDRLTDLHATPEHGDLPPPAPDNIDSDAERCDECGEECDIDGWDGLCGNCADIAETTCVVCGERFDPETATHDPSTSDSSNQRAESHVPRNKWQ